MGNTISQEKQIKFNIIPSKDSAKGILLNSEATDTYLKQCSEDEINNLARAKCNYVPNNISLNEITYAKSFLESAQASIPIRLCNDIKEVNVIQLMPSADGGMPHTRPFNVICYPDISKLYSNTTLIHELWHIHQRLYSDVWLQVFKSIGWTLWKGELPAELDVNRRFNPDTIDCPLWIFDNKWIPIPIFSDITHPKMNDVQVWFYNPHKRLRVRDVPYELSSYFSDIPAVAFEHPREIAAYMLSDPKAYSKCKGFQKLIESIGNTAIMSYSSNDS